MKFMAPSTHTLSAAAATPQQRGCPQCGHTTARVARRWFDRLLGWGLPGKRYRCAASACAWEGLLLSRARPQRRGDRPRER
jgi:hypothetical protein